MRLNLGCGQDYQEGYTNVDIEGECDIKHNLNKYPYPFKDESVDFILASHIIEHLDEPIKFVEECYRILKKEKVLEIVVPHVKSFGASFGDITHKHFMHESTIHSIIKNVDFELFDTTIKYGRFLIWQKRDITWSLFKQ